MQRKASKDIDLDSSQTIGPHNFPVGSLVNFVMIHVDGKNTVSRVTGVAMAPLTTLQVNTDYEVLDVNPRSVVLLQEGNAKAYDEIDVPLALLNRARTQAVRNSTIASDLLGVAKSLLK